MSITGIYYLTRILAALVTIPCHEAGHALASWLLGDPTARDKGRLSLNPLRHFDLLGAVCMVVAGVGWAKPVPLDARRFKKPKLGMVLTALAGPAANLLLACLSMLLWKLIYYWAPSNGFTWFAAFFMQQLLAMNVGLAVFNLLPIPPLDGSRVALLFLPQELYFRIMRYEKMILAVLLALVVFGVFDRPLAWLNGAVWDLLDNATLWIDEMAYSAYLSSLGAEV